MSTDPIYFGAVKEKYQFRRQGGRKSSLWITVRPQYLAVTFLQITYERDQ